ncbi:MAG: sigma-70 family RNA polymerase sigma factor [Kiritimatiellae bacterium]|nr:sigma-70 family RNA polymerase sigma factor [Kiritimatiellia bacterium]
MSSLLRRARAGDVEAFAALFEPLRPAVYAVARRLVGESDAEDVVMDTYLRAWTHLPGYRGGASLKTWLLRIARNACLDLLRRRSARPLASLSRESPDEPPVADVEDPTVSTPAELAGGRDAAAMLRAALARLDAPHRDVLVMRYEDGLSYAEIAAAMGLRIGTVMSRLFNAKRKLRLIWEHLDRGDHGGTTER